MIPESRGPILVTGPARSGKSEWAERLAAESGRAVVYVATAREDPSDAEWCARIALHRRRRPAGWRTLAVPILLEDAIEEHDSGDKCLLIDSLGTWIANLIELEDADWQVRADRLVGLLAQVSAMSILVAEETGWGIVPAYPVGRRFRDRLGALVRHLGPGCAAVYLVTGGFAIDLRRIGIPLT